MMWFLNKVARIPKSNIFLKSVRLASISTKREFKEVDIQVPWGHIAAKWWEPYDTRPVLVTHGWQDNCQSFDRLILMLDRKVGFLAIDLPGHGHSSRFADGMLYQFVNFLLTLRSITKAMNWPKVSLMGHSLGSVTSYMYAVYFPAEVDFLICLDALKPMVHEKQHIHFIKAIDNFFKYNSFLNGKEPPSYSMDEIREVISKAHKNSIDPEHAKHIYERNVAASNIYPDKYYFTRDPRLKTGSLNNYSQTDLVALANRITMPIFIGKATESGYYEDKKNFYEVLDVIKKVSADCDFHYIPGTHHVHLNQPEKLSGLINDFLHRHNTEDRTIEGISASVSIKQTKIIDTS